jgi:hypothetical protein
MRWYGTTYLANLIARRLDSKTVTQRPPEPVGRKDWLGAVNVVIYDYIAVAGD